MPRAASLAAAIEKAVPGSRVETIPGGKGDFRVKADGRLLWDKRGDNDGEFPEPAQILSQLGRR
ncbi:MAG: Rdx family protein [Planctomycetes bacterium]|nr:Rdx family protein [Planctomycetota bacterium]